VAKKVELEVAYESYQALILQAREAKKAGQYDRAIDLAMQCWVHVDFMMRYAQKYQDHEFDSLECIDLVLELAPPLFHFEALDKLAALLKEQRRIDKQASADLAGKLAEARARMWEAHRVYAFLEAVPGMSEKRLRETFAKDSARIQGLVAVWETTGLVRRDSDDIESEIELRTTLQMPVQAKCSACGQVRIAPRGNLLSFAHCARCEGLVVFVWTHDCPVATA
jgi:hypothetical protein